MSYNAAHLTCHSTIFLLCLNFNLQHAICESTLVQVVPKYSMTPLVAVRDM